MNGFTAAVGAGHERAIDLLRDGKIVSSAPLSADSFVGAAASRTHIFVSTTDAFVTFDADAQGQLESFGWKGGGTNPPAIGPKGHVYAIAGDILFVFPPTASPARIPDQVPGAVKVPE